LSSAASDVYKRQIPMLRGLLSAKAGFGPTLTFLFVSPLLNPIIVGLMWMTFGWKVTLLYAIIAAGVSVLASIILDSLGFERHIIASKSSSANCCAPAKTSPGTTYTPIKVSCCSPAAKAIENPVVTCCSTKAVVSIN
ncbi:permease, partial [Escherichia sp. S69_ASV_4]|nr:permease [Escherichia sp. S69_ASV_4]